jgi:hypothetical protein
MDRHRELLPVDPLEPLEPVAPLEPVELLPVELDPLSAPGVIVTLGALIDAPLDPAFDSPGDWMCPADPVPGPTPPPTDPGEPGTAPPVPPPACANTGAAAIKTGPIVYSKNLFIEHLVSSRSR